MTGEAERDGRLGGVFSSSEGDGDDGTNSYGCNDYRMIRKFTDNNSNGVCVPCTYA